MKKSAFFPMSVNWTRRVLTAAVLAPALLLLACGGDDSPRNRIKPIQATLTIDPFPNSPDPAVYLVKDPKNAQFPDLETVQVRLFTTTPQTFDDYSIEIHFDPSRVQVGDAFEFDPSILGGCNSGTPCAPTCFINQSKFNSTGTLLIGVAKNNTCPDTTVSVDTMLVRIGFIAQTTIDPPGTPIDLIQGPGGGDCEILLGLTDLGIPCVGGNALMTASR
jgi:hypothetical protein